MASSDSVMSIGVPNTVVVPKGQAPPVRVELERYGHIGERRLGALVYRRARLDDALRTLRGERTCMRLNPIVACQCPSSPALDALPERGARTPAQRCPGIATGRSFDALELALEAGL
jgi:hypothetical protein